MEHPIVTLTTDWGYQDFFAGMVKGRLLRDIPGVQIIDIAHDITKYDKSCAIFVVKYGCQGFPEGTIHIIDIDSAETDTESFIVVQAKGQYYIGTDNGIPTAVFDRDYEQAVHITMFQDSNDSFTFAAYDLFCKVAAKLAAGAELTEVGTPVDQLRPFTPILAMPTETGLRTHVVYIDSYGNAYLDVTVEEFEKYREGRAFTVAINHVDVLPINSISSSYLDSSDSRISGAVALVVSATRHLQLAAKRDSAQDMLGLEINTLIDFTFVGARNGII